jgi:hypothetical protein
MATPFMSLTLPVVSVTLGPLWAAELNAALTLVDQHDHSSGNGVAITPAGLNINADLEFNSNNAIELRSTRYDNEGSPLNGVNDIRCMYVSGGDLYYNNAAGTAIQLTSGAGLNAASIGGIGGDFATSTAAVTYSNITKAFTFTRSTGVNANLDLANLSIREAVSSANAITLKSPSSLGAGYNWIFPTAVPSAGQTKILTLDSAGQVAAVYDTDGATLEVSSNTLRVKDLGIVTAKLNDLVVTTVKIADLNVTTGKLAALSVTRAKQEAVGQQISSSCGNFVVSSTSYIAVTNLSVTITTTGRPVQVGLQADGSVNQSVISCSYTGGIPDIYVEILRDSTVIGIYYTSGPSGEFAYVPSGAVQILDTPAAGTYTYSIKAKTNHANQANVSYAKLVAFEL